MSNNKKGKRDLAAEKKANHLVNGIFIGLIVLAIVLLLITLM